MTIRKRLRIVVVVLVGAAILSGASVACRAYRAWSIANDTRSQIMYLIENGGTIGEIPASTAFSADYLGAIFGDDPQLVAQLQSVVQQGLADTPALNLGEVAAMIVTYHTTEDGQIVDIVAHVLGDFSLGQRKPGFHRDGYFRHLLERNLWDWGNSLVGLLGRDMVLFAKEEVMREHEHLLESLLNGNVLPLAESLENPLHYTAVFPEPKRIAARQLRSHLNTIIVKGRMAKDDGQTEVIIMTPSARSARYTTAVLSDLKTASEVALKTKWHGVERQMEWGTVVDPWWAFELAQTSEKHTIIEREENIVRLSANYERVTVNLLLKSLERMGRDLTAMRGTLDKGLDPRIVDAQMQTRKPLHYWSEEHRWGPNWPIAPKETNLIPNVLSEPLSIEPTLEAEPELLVATDAP